jgi:hydrogenase/urease accessory protein HupE
VDRLSGIGSESAALEARSIGAAMVIVGFALFHGCAHGVNCQNNAWSR